MDQNLDLAVVEISTWVFNGGFFAYMIRTKFHVLAQIDFILLTHITCKFNILHLSYTNGCGLG